MSTEIEADVKEVIKSPRTSLPEDGVKEAIKTPRTSPPEDVVKEDIKSPRTSPPEVVVKEDIKSPRTSPPDVRDAPPPPPHQSLPPKVNFNRPQPGKPVHLGNKPTMQRQMSNALQRVNRLLPTVARGQPWMYAAAFVAFYTLIMLFRTSTFGFICIMVYTVLFTLLVLRYYGFGPLVDHNLPRFR